MQEEIIQEQIYKKEFKCEQGCACINNFTRAQLKILSTLT